MRLLLNKVKINQIGRFQGEIEVSFGPHVTGIVGNNGTGKSTILSCIYFALTNRHKRLCIKKKEEAINNKASKDQSPLNPFVELQFCRSDSQDEHYIIRRCLITNKNPKFKSFLKICSTGEIVPENKMDDYIQLNFFKNTTVEAISDLIFVEQGQTSTIITAPPSSRSAIIQRAIGLDTINRGRSILMELLPQFIVKYDNSLDYLEERFAKCQMDIKTLEDEISAIKSKMIPDDQFEMIKKYCENYESKYSIFKQIQQKREKIKELENIIQQTNVEAKNIDQYRSILEQHRMWLKYKNYLTKVKSLNDKASELISAIERLKTITNRKIEMPDKVRESDYYRWYFIKKSISNKKCYICGNEKVNFNGITLDEVDRKLVQIKEKINSYKQELEKYYKIKSTIDSSKEKLEFYENQLKDLDKERQLLGEVQPVEEPDPTIVKKAQKEFDRINSLINLLDENQYQLNLAKANLAELEKKVGLDSFDQLDIDDQLYHRYNKIRLEESTNRQNYKNKLESLQKLKEELEDIKFKLSNIKAYRRRSQIENEFFEDCQRVINAFRQDALPKLIIAKSINKIKYKINEILKKMHSEMEISIDEEGDFIVSIDGQPMPWISGGQTVTLALAWRLALCPDIGFLCLDEPTYGVDKKRLLGIRKILQEWKEYGLGQLIVVSHDSRIIDACDNIIDLNKIKI